MADVPPVVIQFKGDIKDIKQSLKVVEGELKNFQKQTKEAGKDTQTLSAKTVAAGALMAEAMKKAGEAVVHLAKSFVESYTDIGSQVRQMQRVLGGSAEDMSRLRYAAEAVGVSTDTVVRGMKILSTHLEKNDAAAKSLGVSYRDANGQLLPATTIIANLSEKFSNLPPGLERTALAVKAFGRGGLEMLPILGMGKEKLNELAAECDKLGLTLTGQNLQDVKDFTMKQRELHAAFSGLQIAVGKELVPALTNMMNGVITNIIPKLQDFVNGLTGKSGLQGALDGSGNSANHWGRIVRAIIDTILSLKAQLAGLAALFISVWAVAKTIAAINAITTAVGLLRLAYVAAGDAALVASAKEKLVAAGGIIGSIGTLILKVGALRVAHATQAIAAEAAAGAEESVAIATGTASGAMVTETATAGTTAVAMDALAVSAGAAAVAEDAASLGTATPFIVGGIALVTAALVGAGIFLKGKYDSAANNIGNQLPHPFFTYNSKGQPNGNSDQGLVKQGDYWVNPDTGMAWVNGKWKDISTLTTGAGAGAGAGVPAQPTLKQSLQTDVAKQKASVWLKKHGASQGLIDAILGSNDWLKEFRNISRGGTKSVTQYQGLFNRTSAGIKELADTAATARKNAIDTITGQLGTLDAQFQLTMTNDANRTYKQRIADAKSYVGYAAQAVRSARLEEKKTRGTEQHADAVKALNSALAEQAKIQGEVNSLTQEAAQALANQAKQQALLNSTMTASNTYLANQVKRSGPGANEAHSYVTVPVIIDGQTVFRVTQKVSLQNNRRNVSNGLAVSGSVI